MAIHNHIYRPYTGPFTPAWSRFLAVYRHSKQDVFRSKFQTAFFTLCFIYPVVCLLIVFLAHNPGFLGKLGIQGNRLMVIDHKFFYYLADVQGMLAFFFTVFAGPGVISPDLTDRALPLYFSRPFSRREYILGKMIVLIVPLSAITWIPGLVVFTIQSGLEELAWFHSNLWLAGSVLISCWIWIALLSLLAMALSSWVRWKIPAGALLLGVFFVGAGFGLAVKSVMQTNMGYLIDIVSLMSTVRIGLFRMDLERPLPLTEALIAMLVICAVSLFLIIRKVRAFEVIQ